MAAKIKFSSTASEDILCAVSSPEGMIIYDQESIRSLDPQLHLRIKGA